MKLSEGLSGEPWEPYGPPYITELGLLQWEFYFCFQPILLTTTSHQANV